MPRKAKQARYWFRRRAGRPTKLVILDHGREYETGLGECGDREAEAALAQYLAGKHIANTQERDQAKIEVGEVLVLYLEQHAPETRSAPQIAAHAKALLPFWRNRKLNEVKASTCKDYARERSRAVSLSTVRRELVTLQAAINYWHAESPLISVPVVTKPQESRRRIRYLRRSEAAALLWACRRLSRRVRIGGQGAEIIYDYSHVARFILIGIYTGTRHGAINGLRWYDSEDSGHIDVAAKRIFRRGSAEDESNKLRPTSRLPNRLLAHCERWCRQDLGRGPQAAIIRWNGKRMVKQERAWELVRIEAKLGADVTPHTLRHTCVTWALQAGMEPWDVAGLTGMSLKTLEATYGHQDADFQQAAARAFMGVSWAKTGTD
ncbi:tyrosine-type recombinase/integrase [Aestuariivirga litoralis]|uniref:tyrosine-type recombinase/integrase n=1 Tax=Aestuariivirga litoralis TaxID=2650924 RepID=UPI0018C4CF30|nr:tyrosine-type recombinase/integrase [Aestuariivirga litoralis]MBG1233006.1 tyrosine-type recombinase/integrase [Aestuariivirga litoralis]